MRRLLPLSLICTFLMAGVARSTTVIPPTFESLVSSANTIFVGEVMDVRAEWMATPQGRAIRTYVTFKVEEVWKGAVGAVTQLEFLGGTIGERRWKSSACRRSAKDSAACCSCRRKSSTASPLVGFWHGRMRVEKDPYGVDRVRTYDGRSLGNPSEVGAHRPNYMLSVTPMRLADLAAAVRSRVLAGRAR